MGKMGFNSLLEPTEWDNKLATVLPLFSDDTLAPIAYLELNRSRSYDKPEEKLMFALLTDAVYCFQHYFDARSHAGLKLYVAAEEWILQMDVDWPFSFENVCQHLGIEPNCFRGALQHWKNCRLLSMASAALPH
jgi:hypothetical protein